MARKYKVGDMVPCPVCSTEIPLELSEDGERLVAYHDCVKIRGMRRRDVISIPNSAYEPRVDMASADIPKVEGVE